MLAYLVLQEHVLTAGTSLRPFLVVNSWQTVPFHGCLQNTIRYHIPSVEGKVGPLTKVRNAESFQLRV